MIRVRFKKIVIISLILFLITGCNVEYNLDLTDDNFTENVNIYLDSSSSEESLNYYLENDINAFFDGDATYVYKKEKIENPLGMNLKFGYGDIASYSVSSFLKQCFNKTNISSDEEYIYISADEFLCQSYDYEELNSAVINFTTNHTVINHNANIVRDGVYTWNLNSNFSKVSLKLKKVKETENIQNQESDNKNVDNKKNNNFSTGIAIIIFIAFIGVIFLLAIFKVKKQRR